MRRRVSCFPTAVFVCLLAADPAAAQVPPDEAWRTVETEHFRVTFPEHLEALGRRAGDLAEQAHRELTTQFREGPSGRIDVVLTDHVDVSNGFARFWPSNRIVLFARPPADHLALAYFDDWLELLITHELAHVFHLDYGGTPGRIFRALFGRALTPLNFPGTVVPGWVVEGLATWYESALTGAGRVHGTFHEMVLRTAMLEGRFESIGQAGGNSPQWPGGIRRYAYGSLFFDYLLDKHGRDGMAAFVEAVARPLAQIPLPRLNAAGRRAFGVSLSSEWSAWTDEMRARLIRLDGELAAYGPISAPEALTRNARYALHPMVSPDGGALIYVRSDGRSYPSLVVMAPDGGDPATVTRINNRTPFDILPAGGDRLRTARVHGSLQEFQRPARRDRRRGGAARDPRRQAERPVGRSRGDVGRRRGGGRGNDRPGSVSISWTVRYGRWWLRKLLRTGPTPRSRPTGAGLPPAAGGPAGTTWSSSMRTGAWLMR